ncbi:hypothetical protein MRX96_052994, partial [Rhipicephalus microplus]
VPDEDVRLSLLHRPARSPTSSGRDGEPREWRKKFCTTRVVTLKINAEVKIDHPPRQRRVTGELAIVPGKAPLCLRCRGTDHIRRECRILRCGVCRPFGHKDNNCQQTYASVTAPGTSEESADHLVGEADLTETAAPTSVCVSAPSTSSFSMPGQREKEVLAEPVMEDVRETKVVSTTKAVSLDPMPQASVNEPVDESMDVDQVSANATAGKQPHESISSKASKEDGGTEGSATPPEHSSGAALEATDEGDKHSAAPGTNVDTAAVDDATAASKSSKAARKGGPGTTDAEMTKAGAIALKRARETPDSTANVDTSTTGELPTKTAIGQRFTFKSRPNPPPDRKGTQTSPPSP